MIGLPPFLQVLLRHVRQLTTALNKKYSSTLCVYTEVSMPTEIICLKTSTSDEQNTFAAFRLLQIVVDQWAFALDTCMSHVALVKA